VRGASDGSLWLQKNDQLRAQFNAPKQFILKTRNISETERNPKKFSSTAELQLEEK
jgi:hypothetical protein